MENETQEQAKNSVEHLKPWQYKKGQSGNPGGRPKGISLKEYARNKLASMTDEEREEFMEGLSKDTIWEMGEGRADTKTDITSNGLPILQVSEAIAIKNGLTSSPEQNSNRPASV